MAANTNTVTLSTNLNVDPYYDDFDETKNYHRVLYRPGLAVQGRADSNAEHAPKSN